LVSTGHFHFGGINNYREKKGALVTLVNYVAHPPSVDFNPVFAPTVSISSAVLDADIIISMPRFKTHGLTIITGAIKNSYGPQYVPPQLNNHEAPS
jgi:uncharacterized protein (DUF362 family)